MPKSDEENNSYKDIRSNVDSVIVRYDERVNICLPPSSADYDIAKKIHTHKTEMFSRHKNDFVTKKAHFSSMLAHFCVDSPNIESKNRKSGM